MKLTSFFSRRIDPALYPDKITSTEFRNDNGRMSEYLEPLGLQTGYEGTIQLVATRNRFSNTYTLRAHFQKSTRYGNRIEFKDAKETVMQDISRDKAVIFMMEFEDTCRTAYLGMWAASAMANAHKSLKRIYSYNTDDHVKPLAERLTQAGTGPLVAGSGAAKTMAGRLARMHKHRHRN